MIHFDHFNHFDILAPLYDRFVRPKDPTRLRVLAGLPVSGRLLDVGGGTGRISYSLRNLVTEAVIADSSMGMCIQVTRKNGLNSVCSNSEELPFENESFERVIMVDALHHVGDYLATIAELWRVVTPGGRIVIEEPDIRTTSIKLMAIIEKLALMRSHFVSPQSIRDAFNYKNASARIEKEGTTAWVVIDKGSD
jgi:demethylmenaquinone methyltransferase/2-methoxy-6-polyprenyl-1,4-benzoquinol methylase